jgi:hypothetical protein
VGKKDILNTLMEAIEAQVRSQLTSLNLDRQTIEGLVDELLPEIRPTAPPDETAILLQSLTLIKSGGSQKEVIDLLLSEVSKGRRGSALILLTGSTSTIWAGPGYGLEEDARAGSKKFSIKLGEDSLTRQAATAGEVVVASRPTSTEEEIFSVMGVSMPHEFVLVPMTINGRVQALVLTDDERGPTPNPAGIAILVGLAGMVIETLPFRDRIGFSQFPRYNTATPTMEEEGEPFPAITLKQRQAAAAAEEPREEGEPEPEPVSTPDVETPEPEPDEEPESQTAAEPAAEAEPETEEEPDSGPASPGADTIDSYTRRLQEQMGEAGEQEVEEPQSPAETSAHEEEAAAESELETEMLEETEIEFLEPPDGEEQTKDYELSLAEQPAPMLETTEETPVEEIGAVESDEQAPPVEKEDVDDEPAEETAEAGEPAKPGISYEGLGLSGYKLDQYEGAEKKQHEKAIRFARLLVSEIKLYNEEQVKLGRENADISSRLREDIARSKALYDQRIQADIRDNTRYFHMELVRQLAGGDESLLG